MTQSLLIAAERQRARIPAKTALEFEEITNQELSWMTRDQEINHEVRIYAGWELDFREASGIEVYFDAETDSIRRRRS